MAWAPTGLLISKNSTIIKAFTPNEVLSFPKPYILQANAIGIAPIVAMFVALCNLQKVSGILITPTTPAKRKKIPKVPNHKNGVTTIHGIVLVLTPKSKKNLETILGKKIKERVEFKDGTVIYIEPGKKDRYKSIIVCARDLGKVKKIVGRSGKVEMFQGSEVVRIDPPLYDKSLSWNLLIKA